MAKKVKGSSTPKVQYDKPKGKSKLTEGKKSAGSSSPAVSYDRPRK